MNCKAEEKLYSRWSLLWYLIIAAATVAVDQISKYITVLCLKPDGDFTVWEGVLHFTYVENRGAAFGMLSDNRWVFMVTSVILIAAVLAVMIIYVRKIPPFLGVSLAFVLGGGIGNMIDRIACGYVVDFINVVLIDFAVFNIADSFICIGAGLMFIYVIVSEVKEDKAKKKKAAENAASRESEDDGTAS